MTFPFFGQGQINYGSNNGKYLTIRDTKVYYEEYGKGTPLLMLHGGFSNMAYFKKCIPELSKHFQIILPDQPGLGRSEFPDSALSYQLIAEYYSSMIDQLKLDSVYVIGESDGGNEGLLLANYRPDKVKRLLISGANYKAREIKGIVEVSNMLNTDWIEANWKDWIDNYKKLSPSGDWKRYVKEARKMSLAEEYFSKQILEEIKVPVLVAYGDNDLITLNHGIEIKNDIKNSQFCIIPNCSHDVFNDKSGLIDRIAIDFFSGN